MKHLRVLAIFVLTVVNVSTASALDFVMSEDADLNGDGTIENIRLKADQDAAQFTLYINKNQVTRTFEGGEPANGFAVIDIKTADKYKEIAVHSPGASDDNEYYIFWYDGNSIIEMDYLSRWPTFYGNGIVTVDNWIDFWSQRDKYVLNDKTRTLSIVPQELYYVGVEAEVRTSFPIYKTRTGPDIVANLKPGSKCLILVCDTSPAQYTANWYLIKSTTGLVGWARPKALYDNLTLPLAD
jgi:hypothetical protein